MKYNMLCKQMSTIVLGLAISTFTFGFKPSECPRFLPDYVKDIYSVNDFVGVVFMFPQEKDQYGSFIDRYSNQCSYLNPDTIIVHHKKKGMVEGVDFFVMSAIGSKLTYKEKKSYSYEQKFNPQMYNEKDFRKYTFCIKIDENEKRLLYTQQWRLLKIDTMQTYSLVLENVATNIKILYKLCKSQEDKSSVISLIPCELSETIANSFPEELYDASRHYSKLKTSTYVNLLEILQC